MEQKQKVLQCLYCGNKTLMNKVGEYRFDDSDDLVWFYRISRMYFCPVCNRISLTEEECFSEDCYPGDHCHTSEDVVYPINSLHNENHLPQNIKQAFEASLKVKNIDNAICLIALRKVLDLVCKEKDAKGHHLIQKIKNLEETNVLPSTLVEASTITRLLGNIGAHDDVEEVSSHDLNQVVEFVKYILDYLYILPAKIKSLQRILDNHGDKE